MTNNSSPEKSSWGWKAVIIVCILGALFMGIFYLAVSNEPDYMPMNQKKAAAQSEMSESSMTTETMHAEHEHHH
mgnify:CR=1 FL=1